MDSNTVINRLKKVYDGNIDENIIQQILNLCDSYPIKKIYNNVNLFKTQLEYGLNDIEHRFNRIQHELNPKDSSSLKSFILKFGDEMGNKLFQEKSKKTAITEEKYIAKYGKIKGKEEYRKYIISKTHSLESYIMRHGEEQGKIKFREYWDNTNFSTSLDAFKRRHGEEEGVKKYNQTCAQIGYSQTLEGFRDQYGYDEGTTRYNEYITFRKNQQSKKSMVKKLLKEGMSFDEIQLKIESRWSRSLKTFINKYGKEKGTEKYQQYIAKLRKINPVCLDYYKERNIPYETAIDLIFEINKKREFHGPKGGCISKESLSQILPIVEGIFEESGYQCLYGSDEHKIKLSKEENSISGKKYLLYDFTFPKINFIIEYHGEFFHEDVDYDSTKQMSLSDFKDNYEYDLFKKWIAEQRGYNVFIVRSWKLNEDKKRLFNYLKDKGFNLCPTKFL